MSLSKWVIEDYGVPFILIRREDTLRTAQAQLRAGHHEPNRTFLVYHDSQGKWRVGLYSAVFNQTIKRDDLLLSLPIEYLPLQLADEVVSVDTTETGDQVVDRLLQISRNVFVILQVDKVVAVLYNTVMGGDSEEAVQFTAFCSSEVAPSREYSLLVYAHLVGATAEVTKHAEQYARELGVATTKPRRSQHVPMLKRGTNITVLLEVDEQISPHLHFKPTSITIPWDHDWESFPFSFTASPDIVGHIIPIRVSAQVADVEIGFINLAIDIIESGAVLETQILQPTSGRLYQKIFISYSRKDTAVVRRYYQAMLAAANDVFFDVESIRAGANWQEAIKRALIETDFLQLFWSQHSAESENVRFEWQYFLKHCCEADDCDGRLRPVYWQTPLVRPPEELCKINFRFVPFED